MGFMKRSTVRRALDRYGPTLSLAALGAIEKKGMRMRSAFFSTPPMECSRTTS